jgi:hypothetical protein
MAVLEYRIHANYSAGAGWRWEVATDRDLIARGIAGTHAQARTDMMRAVASSPAPKPIRSTRVLTSHLNWYGRLYRVWKARTHTRMNVQFATAGTSHLGQQGSLSGT